MTKFRISSVTRQYFWIERDLVVVIIGVKRENYGTNVAVLQRFAVIMV